jgi:hypothetical protein
MSKTPLRACYMRFVLMTGIQVQARQVDKPADRIMNAAIRMSHLPTALNYIT